MTPIGSLGDSPSAPDLQMKVPYSGDASELVLIVPQASDDVSACHGLPLFDENLPDVAIGRNEGFSFPVVAMIDDYGGAPAFLDVRLRYTAVRDGDDGLSGRSRNVDALMDVLSAFPTDPDPATKVGDDPVAGRCARCVHDIVYGSGRAC